MVISVQELAVRPLSMEREYAPGEIDFQDPSLAQIGPLRARIEAKLAGPELRMHVQLAGAVEAPCARCLQPRRIDVDTVVDLIYHPASELAPLHEKEIHRGDTEVGFFAGPGVELEEALREQVMLALPMRILCRDECRGLCPHCGRNLNAESCPCATQSSAQ